MDYLTGLRPGQGMIKAIFANNLPSSLTHGDTVAVGSLQLSLARKGSFTTGQRQRKCMLSVGTLASRRKERTRRLGCAFLILSSNLTQIHSSLGKKIQVCCCEGAPSTWKETTGVKQKCSPFHNDNKPIFFFLFFFKRIV